jgi:hypothetical protein
MTIRHEKSKQKMYEKVLISRYSYHACFVLLIFFFLSLWSIRLFGPIRRFVHCLTVIFNITSSYGLFFLNFACRSHILLVTICIPYFKYVWYELHGVRCMVALSSMRCMVCIAWCALHGMLVWYAVYGMRRIVWYALFAMRWMVCVVKYALSGMRRKILVV